ncbi:MAG TPA: ATP-binding protein, partial [Patescibacteria group bacterium]|nr:ATP-binding protein [Patescibacteria group bacterium]
LLILASLDAGAVKALSEPVNLVEVITDILANIAYESPDRAADLIFAKPERAVIVLGDRALLSRAIENVLRNAVFYTAAGAAIEVTCQAAADGRVRVTLRDQGPGVPEQALARLFDPFYRVDDARTRQTGGTGIGLAICRRAVELHHGSVRARNLDPHGLEVVMDLPQATENVTPEHISTQLHNQEV